MRSTGHRPGGSRRRTKGETWMASCLLLEGRTAAAGEGV